MQFTKLREAHKVVNLPLRHSASLRVSSDFDQGNLQSARIVRLETDKIYSKILPKNIIVQAIPALQPFNPACSSRQSSKTLFNFSVSLQIEDKIKQVNLANDEKNQPVNTKESRKRRFISNRGNSDSSSDEGEWRSVSSKEDANELMEYAYEQEKMRFQSNKEQEEVNDADDQNTQKSSQKMLLPENNHEMAIEFRIKRMNVVNDFDTFLQYYRPCIGTKDPNKKYSEPEYSKFLPSTMKLKKQNDNSFTFIFSHTYVFQFDPFSHQQYLSKEISSISSQQIFFAYHFPYNNEKLRNYTLKLEQTIFQRNKEMHFLKNSKKFIYFRNQFLIETTEGRPINLLTLTSTAEEDIKKQSIDEVFSYHYSSNEHVKELPLNFEREPRISKSLFPYYEIEERPYHFKKPFVMITCRVHPGQTSSSYALEGFLNKLVDGSPQSCFLLKTFTFKIIPIINPDGVYYGTYRMDLSGQNLNRFYDLSVSHKQPSIFAAQTLIHFYASSPQSCLPAGQNTLQVYMDFHAHSKLSPPFIYGNAYQGIVEQTETQLFCKLLQENSEIFYEDYCSFSEKNMNSRDTVQLMSKSGSARLCAYRIMKGSMHNYTLEMGYIGCKLLNPIKDKTNKQIKQQTEEDPEIQPASKSVSKKLNSQEQAKNQIRIFDDDDYRKTGEEIVITMADIYIKSLTQVCLVKVKYTNEESMQSMREELGKQIFGKEDRFRIKESNSTGKLKNVHALCLSNIYMKFYKQFPKVESYLKEYYSSLPLPEQKSYQQQIIITMKDFRSKTPVQGTFQKFKKPDPLTTTFYPKSQILSKDHDPTSLKSPTDDKKIFKSKISVTPIKFTIDDPGKKNMKYVNLRKMIEFYSNTQNQFDHKIKIPKGKADFKVKTPSAANQTKNNIIRGSFSEKKGATGYFQKRNNTTKENHKKIRKQNSLNEQLENDISKQGFSFYLQGSQSQKKIERNTPILSKKQEAHTISYENKQNDTKKNQERHHSKSPDKKFRIIREIRVQESIKRTTKVNPPYELGNTERVISKSLKRQALKTPSSSLGYVYGEQGVEQITGNTENIKMSEPQIYSSKQTNQSNWRNRNAFLPKLQLLKPDKRDRKYEIELKIKEKYDKKYKVENSISKNNFMTTRANEVK